MERNSLASSLINNATLTLRASNNALHAFLNFFIVNDALITTSGQNSSLIEKVGKISARKTWSKLCQTRKINVVGHRLIFGMNAQDFLTTLNVWNVNYNLAIKTTRTKKRRVQNV